MSAWCCLRAVFSVTVQLQHEPRCARVSAPRHAPPGPRRVQRRAPASTHASVASASTKQPARGGASRRTFAHSRIAYSEDREARPTSYALRQTRHTAPSPPPRPGQADQPPAASTEQGHRCGVDPLICPQSYVFSVSRICPPRRGWLHRHAVTTRLPHEASNGATACCTVPALPAVGKTAEALPWPAGRRQTRRPACTVQFSKVTVDPPEATEASEAEGVGGWG